MLVPGILGSRDEYGQRYCGGQQQFIARGMYDWRGSSNLTELNAVLQRCVSAPANMLRQGCVRVCLGTCRCSKARPLSKAAQTIAAIVTPTTSTQNSVCSEYHTVNSLCKDTRCKDTRCTDNLDVRTTPLVTNHCLLTAVVPLGKDNSI